MEGISRMPSKSTAAIRNSADSGRVRKTLQSPRLNKRARRKYSSIIGLRMNPSNKGAVSSLSLMKRYDRQCGD